MKKRLLQSLIIRNDLEEAKSEIEAKGLFRSMAHIKIAFLAFHNLCELEKTIRSMYKDHQELSTKFDAFRPQAKFFSYLRNKFTGHLTDDLIDKALEWQPALSLTLNEDHGYRAGGWLQPRLLRSAAYGPVHQTPKPTRRSGSG